MHRVPAADKPRSPAFTAGILEEDNKSEALPQLQDVDRAHRPRVVQLGVLRKHLVRHQLHGPQVRWRVDAGGATSSKPGALHGQRREVAVGPGGAVRGPLTVEVTQEEVLAGVVIPGQRQWFVHSHLQILSELRTQSADLSEVPARLLGRQTQHQI